MIESNKNGKLSKFGEELKKQINDDKFKKKF